jgi:small subunit ribosomal protein S8
MSMSDPLADMLTRIRNAGMARFDTVSMPLSNLKISVAKVLKDEGYIRDFHILKDSVQGTIRLDLKYGPEGEKVISGLRRVSKPGRRIYVHTGNITPVLSGLGVAVLSTSRGVITDRDARRQGIGGEVLLEIW